MVDGRDLSLSLREKRNREAHCRPIILQNTYVHSNVLFEEMTHKKRHMLKLFRSLKIVIYDVIIML